MEGNNTFVKVFLAIFFTIFILAWVGPFMPIILPFLKALNPIWYLVVAIVILIIWIMSSYNKFVHLVQKVNQSAGTIDVYLKQRFDLIPNLVETVKGYAKYEENVIQKITELRAEYANNNNANMSVSAELNNRYNQLLAVVENYPELKANESFLNLQKQLSKVESQLQAARRIYNSDVTVCNTKVHCIQSNIIAGIFGFKPASLFEIQAHERENVNINI